MRMLSPRRNWRARHEFDLFHDGIRDSARLSERAAWIHVDSEKREPSVSRPPVSTAILLRRARDPATSRAEGEVAAWARRCDTATGAEGECSDPVERGASGCLCEGVSRGFSVAWLDHRAGHEFNPPPSWA